MDKGRRNKRNNIYQDSLKQIPGSSSSLGFNARVEQNGGIWKEELGRHGTGGVTFVDMAHTSKKTDPRHQRWTQATNTCT